MARCIAALALSLVLLAGCSPAPVYRSPPGSVPASPRKGQSSGDRDRNRNKKPAPVIRPEVPAHPVDLDKIPRDKAYQIGDCIRVS